ncbi:M48 family metalloprotease [Dokdonella sp. MW10]|uniref:M48 family metalloprotease n=1 Tax=Dokdonella sp. MW10 TaxID=2992926 RepID=UPI003F819794
MQAQTTSGRESFHAAQARHRAAARRWSLLAGAIVAALALTISLLFAPLAILAVGLFADFANLVTPTPNLLGEAFKAFEALTDGKASAAGITLGLAVAAIPGMLLLGAGWLTLARVSRGQHADVVGAALGWRAPRLGDLEEQQLRNLVDEMAIAAGLPPPRLMLIDDDSPNLAILGEGADAVIVATRGLLDRLPRAPTQALVGQAIAALGNGDGLLAARMLRLIEMCGLLMLLSQAPMSAKARALLAPLLPWRRGGDALDTLRHALGDPWNAGFPDDVGGKGARLTWKDWLRMPLMGSLLIGILLVPVTLLFLLAPLLGLVWRRRRLLADATAVQFTRDPQALAEACAALAPLDTTLPLKAPWLVNLFVLDVMGPGATRVASPYPTLARRIERLNGMGAAVEPPPTTPPNVLLSVLLSPLLALLVFLVGVLLVLGTWLSLALSMLFLGLPVGVLHLLLRHLGGG